ncbi:MAG: hypothetical protein KDE50_29565 [Caldilineaceae bacterium]|nr:hypothetical protein [Caldilineaceae bacterium]
MSLPKINISPNGEHKAPPNAGGAFIVENADATLAAPLTAGSGRHAEQVSTQVDRVAQVMARRTVFPEVTPTPTTRTLLYELSRYYMAGAPLFRWLVLLLLAVGLVWLGIQAPGGWIGAAPWGIAALALIYLRRLWRSNGFVHFETAPPPTVEPQRLPADQKLPIHATGRFGVEGKEQYDTWLPGFYRTFATREHALLCRVMDKKVWGFGRRPPDEIGMWYIFFAPDAIEGVRWGQLHFGAEAQLAVAVDYKVEVQAEGRFRNAKTKIETLLIATQNEEDARTIMADLLFDLSDA